jgi:hypothetical protein
MLGTPEILMILASLGFYIILAGLAVYIIGAGVYFGNKWTKKGELPGILRGFESKDNKKG